MEQKQLLEEIIEDLRNLFEHENYSYATMDGLIDKVLTKYQHKLKELEGANT